MTEYINNNMDGMGRKTFLSLEKMFSSCDLRPSMCFSIALIAAAVCAAADRTTLGDDATIRVVQWNIGHFAMGRSNQTAIEPEESAAKCAAYRAEIARLKPDFLGVSEFDAVFDKAGRLSTNEVFSSFPVQILGPKNNYQCNALFTRFPILRHEVVNYTSRAQHTYFLDCVFMMGTNEVHFVQSHLDWKDLPGRPRHFAQLQVRQLIEHFKDKPRVIISADYNINDIAMFAPFVEAGYDVANKGRYAILDNVVVKGFEVTNLFDGDGKYPRRLSDHRIVGCDLKLSQTAAALPDMAGTAPEPSGGWKTKAISISVPAPKDVRRFCSFVKNTLKPSGVEAIVLLVRYNFKFASHPECAGSNAISLADAKAIKRACDEAGVRLIPKMNLLGHQSGAVVKEGLLKGHPELDESCGKEKIIRNYCRSVCPTHPDSLRIVTDLAGEMAEAFGADTMHIGCDEVFEIGLCPRCRETPTAKLFADWVNGIARYLKASGVTTMMWGDRLLDAKTTGYGVWEASDNGTNAALGMLDKDIIICDWHYENRPAYPSVEVFANAGRKIFLCPWRYAENAQKFLAYAVAHDKGQYLGLLFTTWCACEDLMDVLEGKGVTRHKPDTKQAQTLVALRRNFRYLFPKSKQLDGK